MTRQAGHKLRSNPATDNLYPRTAPDNPIPLVGIIRDTNSRGRYDLLVYASGILAIKGNYWRTARLAAGAGVGAGGLAPAVLGAAISRAVSGKADRSSEDKTTQAAPADLVALHTQNFFLPASDILQLALEKRWYGVHLDVESSFEVCRRFSWKPALNNFHYVREILRSTFPKSTL
jgi:hypothetical protein